MLAFGGISSCKRLLLIRMEMWKRHLPYVGELNEVICCFTTRNGEVEWMEWNGFKSQEIVILLLDVILILFWFILK